MPARGLGSDIVTFDTVIIRLTQLPLMETMAACAAERNSLVHIEIAQFRHVLAHSLRLVLDIRLLVREP